MAGLSNAISCTNGQHTEGKSVHTFPLKEKDRKRRQAGSGLCEDIGQSGAAPTRLFCALTISMRAALRRIWKSLPISIVVGRPFRCFAPYIELIVSHTGECFFGLKTNHHLLIALYCEDEFM